MREIIYKYLIERKIHSQLTLPLGAQILSAGYDAEKKLCIWVKLDNKAPSIMKVDIWVIGTGWEMIEDLNRPNVEFVGTVFQLPYVWHVFCRLHDNG